MLLKLNNENQKELKIHTTKKGFKKEITVKKQLYLYAHNGKGFDSYVIMNDPYIKEIQNISFNSIVKNSSGVLNLSIEMPNVVVNL